MYFYHSTFFGTIVSKQGMKLLIPRKFAEKIKNCARFGHGKKAMP
nr:MAG TPA: CREB-regulated transcription coactivator 2-helix, CREB binding, CREB, PROTEIN.0A [Caudoviricetes sp.]